jgi:hypothetical protein
VGAIRNRPINSLPSGSGDNCTDGLSTQPNSEHPANGNAGKRGQNLRAETLIAADSPVTQNEIEVFAVLLDDWDAILAECNREIVE